jgi:uncharacterized repeat protein (TIGR04138 family)
MAVDRPHFVQTDARCVHCTYNLRGLPFNGNCPECGRPVLNTVRIKVRWPRPTTPEARKALEANAARLGAAARNSGYPQEAFLLVIGAMHFAGMGKGPGTRVSARDVCDGLREYAPLRLGGIRDALLTMAAWNIRRSEDVGRIIFRMVEAGRLRASDGDSEDDFKGIFTLNDFFGNDAPAAVAGGEQEPPQQDSDDAAVPHGVPLDVPCEDCGYNLRGLPSDGRCPECGHSVDESLRAAETTDESVAYRLERAVYRSVAKEIGYPVDGVMFVADAFKLARRRAGGRFFRRNPVAAAAVCRALSDHARGYFNDEAEAGELLKQWRVTCGEDVGVILNALARTDVINRRAASNLGSFAGLFTVADLLQDWSAPRNSEGIDA